MDIWMDRQEALEIYENGGYLAFLKHAQLLAPLFYIYQVSESWVHSPRYIAKAKGQFGDIVFHWT